MNKPFVLKRGAVVKVPEGARVTELDPEAKGSHAYRLKDEGSKHFTFVIDGEANQIVAGLLFVMERFHPGSWLCLVDVGEAWACVRLATDREVVAATATGHSSLATV